MCQQARPSTQCESVSLLSTTVRAVNEVRHKLWATNGAVCEQSAFWPCAYEPPAKCLILTGLAKVDRIALEVFAQ